MYSKVPNIFEDKYLVYALCKLFIFFVQIHAFLSIWKIINTFAPDFSVFYYAGFNWINNINLYTSTQSFTAFGYPPYTAFVYSILNIFPYNISQCVWVILSYLSLFVIVNQLFKLTFTKFTQIQVLVIQSLMFLSFPTKFTLGMGQSNIFILLGILICLRYIYIYPFLSGLLMGIVMIMKPHTMILMIPLLLHKHYKVIAYSLMCIFIVVFVTLSTNGIQIYIDYYYHLVLPLTEYVGRDIYYNQGIGAMFARLLSGNFSLFVTNISSVILISLGVIFSLKNKNIFYSVSIFLVILLLIEPLAWQHHLIFAFPAIFYIAAHRTVQWVRIWLVMVYILISYNIKSAFYMNHSLWSSILLSHGSIGLVLLFILMTRNSHTRIT